ncbi:MAG: PLP-dependent aminotransferase family protein [Burkholderiales bacterium]|nr:PLP-dependent aminotransferase family protein [Burkholderiales bacterium]
MLLVLDGSGELYRQLGRALRTAMAEGRLAAGSRLPSTRELALQLGLSRNTVLAAYELLRAERMIEARTGRGSFVAAAPARRGAPPAPVEPLPAPSMRAARQRALPPLPLPWRQPGVRIDLQYGEPLTHVAVFTAWSRCLAQAAAHLEPGYVQAQGRPELRAQIAAYLSRRRGLVCTAGDIVVVHGTQRAISLLARVLVDPGQTVVVEEPGYALARQALFAHGAAVRALPVDAQGLVVERLAGVDARLILVTPSHQFPLGVAMSLERRRALLRHAHEHAALIVEDDYDGEFGIGAGALPTLSALDGQGRTIHVGTFSKSLLPSLRLGYIVCPPGLRRDLVQAKRLEDISCAALEQQALARFMAGGGFERHLRRTALELRRRRSALVEGLRGLGERVRVQDSGSGMHLLAWLPGLDASALAMLIDDARRCGLALHPLSAHYEQPPAEQALLLGFACASAAQIREAVGILGACLDRVGPHRAP